MRIFTRKLLVKFKSRDYAKAPMRIPKNYILHFNNIVYTYPSALNLMSVVLVITVLVILGANKAKKLGSGYISEVHHTPQISLKSVQLFWVKK